MAISICTRVFETRVIKCFIAKSKTAFKIIFDPLSKLAEQAKIHIFFDVEIAQYESSRAGENIHIIK